ncbi:phosphotransferase [Kribbella sp. NPDC048915]|uniref:phosphotransferase n=1 Tax=Kribbella sp. NPDC048915 TaxID=3155148 RepID=UPI0033EDCB98
MGNLLAEDGRITGIVDIEAAGSGTRGYDLVSLAASAFRDGAAEGVDEVFLEAALRASGRAAVAICAAAAFASVAEFAHERPPYAVDLVNGGGRRIVELLDA